MTTLAKDPHGDVDEPQFIDASKLVSKDTNISAIRVILLRTGLQDCILEPAAGKVRWRLCQISPTTYIASRVKIC